MSRHTKAPRRFIRERRRNACPACLDRHALNLIGRPLFVDEVSQSAGCGVCDGKGYVNEVFPVGNEWRRYPWVIT